MYLLFIVCTPNPGTKQLNLDIGPDQGLEPIKGSARYVPFGTIRVLKGSGIYFI